MIKVVSKHYKIPEGALAIDTTSRSNNWSVGLSPFFLGPCNLYRDYVSQNVENAWQYSKVYEYYADDDGSPGERYFKWAEAGWKKIKAERYPMGRDAAKPLYSYWDGKKYGYTDGRQAIYIPLYAQAVLKSFAYKKLKQIYEEKQPDQILYLSDFDSHSLDPGTFDYWDLWNNPNIKVGHGYVIAMLLEGILKEEDYKC